MSRLVLFKLICRRFWRLWRPRNCQSGSGRNGGAQLDGCSHRKFIAITIVDIFVVRFPHAPSKGTSRPTSRGYSGVRTGVIRRHKIGTFFAHARHIASQSAHPRPLWITTPFYRRWRRRWPQRPPRGSINTSHTYFYSSSSVCGYGTPYQPPSLSPSSRSYGIHAVDYTF